MDFSQKTEVWQAFDKLFDTTRQAQERESQGQRLNNLASAIDKIDSTKLNSERLEENELTSLLDDTKTFIEMIKSNELSNDEKAHLYSLEIAEIKKLSPKTWDEVERIKLLPADSFINKYNAKLHKNQTQQQKTTT